MILHVHTGSFSSYGAVLKSPKQLYPTCSSQISDLLVLILWGFWKKQLLHVMEEVPDTEGHKGIEHWLKEDRKAFVNDLPYIPNLKRAPEGSSHSRTIPFPQAST